MMQPGELIQVEGVSAPIFVRKAPQHEYLKAQLLQAIASMGTHSMVDSQQQISNTDWFLPGPQTRLYMQLAGAMFEEHFRELIAREYSIAPGIVVSTSHYWFQQYQKGDYHGWHCHGNTMFSNVYYLELPEGSAKTSFFTGGKEVSVDVEEGCILSFPSTLLHRSKPNESDRKSVIVVNINVDKRS